MTRVLMFGWEYPPFIAGGLGTACYWLMNALTEKGIKIDFLTPHQGNGQSLCEEVPEYYQTTTIKSEMEHLGQVLGKLLRKISIPSSLTPYPTATISSDTEEHEREDLEKVLEEALNKFNKAASDALKGSKFDLIHAHDWPTYQAALDMQATSNKPLILHVHSTEIDRNGDSGSEFIFKLEEEGFKEADKIIAVSNYSKNMLVDHYQVDPKKIEVVYHGVPPGFDDGKTEGNIPQFREKVVTFCGRITRQKGPTHFINAASKLSVRSNQIRFVMAGDGDLRNNMIELTAGLGLSRRFHFPGFLTNRELKKLWQISDVLVMPSVSEPFGLIGVEAMSANIPVIVSKQSGLAELLPNMLQVDYWETDDLADLIFQAITNPQLVLKQKQENQTRLAGLSWSSAAEQVIDLYHSVIPNGIK